MIKFSYFKNRKCHLCEYLQWHLCHRLVEPREAYSHVAFCGLLPNYDYVCLCPGDLIWWHLGGVGCKWYLDIAKPVVVLGLTYIALQARALTIPVFTQCVWGSRIWPVAAARAGDSLTLYLAQSLCVAAAEKWTVFRIDSLVTQSSIILFKLWNWSAILNYFRNNIDNTNSDNHVNLYWRKISKCLDANKLSLNIKKTSLNVKKTKFMIFHQPQFF